MDLKETIIKEITDITDLLYQQNIGSAYPRLIQLLPKLEEYTAGLEEETKQAWTEGLKSALEAMEQQDATLLADILQYEILEIMEN